MGRLLFPAPAPVQRRRVEASRRRGLSRAEDMGDGGGAAATRRRTGGDPVVEVEYEPAGSTAQGGRRFSPSGARAGRLTRRGSSERLSVALRTPATDFYGLCDPQTTLVTSSFRSSTLILKELSCVSPFLISVVNALGLDPCSRSGRLDSAGRSPFLSIRSTSWATHSEGQLRGVIGGLENSGHRFLWVVRPPDDVGDVFVQELDCRIHLAYVQAWNSPLFW